MPRVASMFAVPLLLAGCAGGVGGLAPIDEASPGIYRLGPGDQLRLAVYGFDQLAGAYTVGDTGTISLPLLSTIPVAGRSPAELETAIAEQLRSRELATNPSVSVQVLAYRPIYILGEVQKPGQYPYVPAMTVTTAVAIAGGYTFRANTKQAAVIRPGEKAERRAAPTTTVLPGDTIRVPEAWF